ncbi:MAG TPA: hypothetical protein VHA82_11810 [Ramlibacter sp.]|uniref:hypothetical protein n=1 Tax=Ramlibacter sp. TaxID=1917967 RepID=UPI002B5484C5|nr:hypothetical protein [Ramlibacter sp.]HVZ44487.1 hypothetical protein [Ramlibacter sp.]
MRINLIITSTQPQTLSRIRTHLEKYPAQLARFITLPGAWRGPPGPSDFFVRSNEGLGAERRAMPI